jgi:DNA-binding CsgD family transcriptional regulator
MMHSKARKLRGRHARNIKIFDVRVAGEDLVVISLPSGLPTKVRGLTRAEHEVARATIAGDSTVTIARRRGRSPRTIANQLASIYRKLGVSSRAELAARLFGEDKSQ